MPKLAVVAVAVAIAVTATMDATGLSDFSALPLLPLLILFWLIQRHSRRNVGFTLGKPRHYALAALHPLVVMGIIVTIAAAAGALDLFQMNWSKTLINMAIVAISTTIVTSLTEEGFFRGWLWASLTKGGLSPNAVLLWTSLAFAAWHISPVVLETGFNPPPEQVPVYLVNVVFIGIIWGLLRRVSGSVIVASVCHGLWNAGAYVLFGFGKKAGAFGIANTAVFGPEVGYLGLALNAAFVGLLWWSVGRSKDIDATSTQ